MTARPDGLLTRPSLAEAALTLAGRDASLARILKTHGTPPLWSRPAGFPTLVRIILEQQVSLASARSIYRRVSSALGEVTPQRFVRAGEEGLRAQGLTRQKAAYCMAAAGALLDGSLDLGSVATASDAEARASLLRVKGIGPWSADIYLLMALRRPDVWPTGDLALVSAVRRLRRLPRRPTTQRLEAIADRWRPYRSVAARMLWQYYLAERAARSRRSSPST